MHPRSIYRDGVDFAQLGWDCPRFAKFLVKGPSQIDFTDPDAVRELTASLLNRDFGLDVDLPDDRLCPPVPNRLNYILWLQDLIDSTSGGKRDGYDPEVEVIGLDIGVGASCIYPLLGCCSRPRWKFVGTDVDKKSITYAKAQVNRNNLSDRIRIVETTTDAPFFDFDKLSVSRLDFTMCNPPFYASPSELLSLSTIIFQPSTHAFTRKRLPPYSPTCTGTPTEMCTPGGELAFALRMVRESHQPHVRTRIQWISILLGLKSSVSGVISEIKSLSGKGGGANWAVTTLTHQYKGSKSGTRRWAVAWSWLGFRPGWGSAVAGISTRGMQGLGIKPFKGVSKFTILFDKFPLGRLDQVMGKVVQVLEVLEKIESAKTGRVVCWQVEGSKEGDNDGEAQTLNGWIKGDIWSRAARRRRMRLTAQLGDESSTLSCEQQVKQVFLHGTPRDGLYEEELQGMWFRISVDRVSNDEDLYDKGDETRNEYDRGDRDDCTFGEGATNSPSSYPHQQEHNSEAYCLTPPPQPYPYQELPIPQPYPYQELPIPQPPHLNIRRGPDTIAQEQPITVTLRWIRGRPGDTVLFESFCGMYKRKLGIA